MNDDWHIRIIIVRPVAAWFLVLDGWLAECTVPEELNANSSITNHLDQWQWHGWWWQDHRARPASPASVIGINDCEIINLAISDVDRAQGWRMATKMHFHLHPHPTWTSSIRRIMVCCGNWNLIGIYLGRPSVTRQGVTGTDSAFAGPGILCQTHMRSQSVPTNHLTIHDHRCSE